MRALLCVVAAALVLAALAPGAAAFRRRETVEDDSMDMQVPSLAGPRPSEESSASARASAPAQNDATMNDESSEVSETSGPAPPRRIAATQLGGGEGSSSASPSAVPPPDSQPTRDRSKVDSSLLDGTPSGRPRATSDAGDESLVGDDADDETIQQLYRKLQEVRDSMRQDKDWIDQVTRIIGHYRMKIRRVQAGLRRSALRAFELKDLIRNQHRIIARKRLEAKLVSVNQAISRLNEASTDVSGKSQTLTTVRESLRRSISAIEAEIDNLRGR